ncbi:MAG: SGNH/GDSL hydrolase family protein [Thermodesulfobacteriota bacterium]
MHHLIPDNRSVVQAAVAALCVDLEVLRMLAARTKRVLRFVIDGLVIALVSISLIELGCWLYHRVNPAFGVWDTGYNRWRGRPLAHDYNGFRLSSRGFKDAEFSLRKEESVFRILGIGDSFTFGSVPYPDCVLTLLRHRLTTQGRYEVINMGICGNGPKEYLSLLAAEGLELSPDLVLVLFFVGNDFANAGHGRSLCSYSYGCTMAKYLFTVYRRQEGLPTFAPGEVYRDDEPLPDYDQFLRMETSASLIFIRAKNWRHHFDSAVHYLAEMNRTCNTNGAKLLTVIIPDRVQVEPGLQAEVIKALREGRWPDNGRWPTLTKGDMDFRGPNKLLAAELDRQKIRCVDLTDEFEKASAHRKLFRANDSHWNIEGNRLAAELVFRHLLSRPALIGEPGSSRNGTAETNLSPRPGGKGR